MAGIADLRDRLLRLVPYRRSIRPSIPTSLPQFIDTELQRSEVVSREIVEALRDMVELVDDVGSIPTDLVTEAPSDSKLYGRKNASWAQVPAGLPEAPADGHPYARKDAGWVLIEPTAPPAPPQSALIPLVTGSVPPVLLCEPDGSLIFAKVPMP